MAACERVHLSIETVRWRRKAIGKVFQDQIDALNMDYGKCAQRGNRSHSFIRISTAQHSSV